MLFGKPIDTTNDWGWVPDRYAYRVEFELSEISCWYKQWVRGRNYPGYLAELVDGRVVEVIISKQDDPKAVNKAIGAFQFPPYSRAFMDIPIATVKGTPRS